MGSRRRPVYTQTALRRALTAVIGIIVVMVVGTVGFHLIGEMSYVDAFYFESMLATGQGPPLQLPSDAAKVFASVMAFISVSSVVTTLIFTLGPIAAMVWREGLERVEVEARKVERELEGNEKEEPKK